MTDPRAYSKEKLTPPAPLPAVSRKALKRIGNDAAPIPTVCHYCNGDVFLFNNSVVYSREYGRWPYLYLCIQCRAYVGLHPSTDIPLGTLANQELRGRRKSAKQAFHALTERKQWTRGQAYSWLADALNIPLIQCHFGMFDLAACEQAERACLIEIEAS